MITRALITGVALFLVLATGTAHAEWMYGRCLRIEPDACIRGGAPAKDACAEGNQEAYALVKQREHGRVQKSTLPAECHFIKWRNMTKLYSCNGEIYDAAQVRAMRAKTKGRNR
jgi:hypothetical protein